MRQEARVRHESAASTPVHRGRKPLFWAAALIGTLVGTTTAATPDPTTRLASALVYSLLFTLGALILHLLIAFVRDTLEG